MKVRNIDRCDEDKIELQMTPMIDIVFLLLVFFIMTFKIVAPEGDFNIKMPKDAPPSKQQPDTVPITIALKADSNGNLTQAVMGARVIDGKTNKILFDNMRALVRNQVGDFGGPGASPSDNEVEFDCDYNLKFKFVIDAITAVSGYVKEDGTVVKIIEKIRFSKSRKPSG
jgi:biopolymer transport protein ExbD